ncbi:autotransporter assembly complex family protein [Orbaceae bacterium ac157xtp]
MKRVLLSFILALTFFAQTALANMKLSIEGLSGKLEENVNARLSLMDEKQISDTPYFRRFLESEVKSALRALGYYAPRFSYSLSKTNDKLFVTIEPGTPVLIEQTDVNIEGSGQNDEDFIHLLNTVPEAGTVLNHGEYDSFRKQLQSIALRKGYFDSELTQHQLAVADKLHQAYWRINFVTGERYRFGKVTFKQSQIRDSYLQNIVPFNDLDFYSSEQLSLLNRRLSSTNWFRSVTVIPLFDKVGEDKILPVEVISVPKKQNSVNVGLGYTNDNGVRGTLGWNKPWLNDRGHSFSSDLSLSSPEQALSGAYKIPLHGSPLEDYYTIQGGYRKINNNDTDSNSYTVGVIRNWDSFEGWQSAVGLNAMYDNFTQADDNYETFLFYPSFSFSRVRIDAKLFPLWGDSQRYSLEAASEDLASDINFIRFQIQQVWIRSLYEQHRFVARANFGIIQASNFDRVPPSFRFFAGGDRSIRGYSFQSISPTDSKNQRKGASKIYTASLEYQYNVSGDWWGAVFVDTGDAIDKFKEADLHTGAGAGLRWASPVGPVKFDVAVPVNRSDSSIHFYIGLGAEL